MTDREAFEAHLGDAASRDDFKTFRDGEYLDPATQIDWELWQAAIKAEREAAARVCEERSRWSATVAEGLPVAFRGADSFANGAIQEAESCAAAIRARSQG